MSINHWIGFYEPSFYYKFLEDLIGDAEEGNINLSDEGEVEKLKSILIDALKALDVDVQIESAE